MATKISGMTAASGANLQGTAKLETVDALGATVAPTYAQLRTALLAGGTGYATTDFTAVSAHARVTAVTNAASGTIATFTPAADGSFLIAANVLVTAVVAASFTVTCSYTDEGNSARVFTLSFNQIGGAAAITTITNVTGVGPYEGVTVLIRAKGGTAITIQTAAGGTYTNVTYNADGLISQVA